MRRLLARFRDSGPRRTAVWGEGLLAAPERELHARLAGAGPFDEIEDPGGGDPGLRFRTAFLHLRDGGVYRTGAEVTPDIADLSEWVEGVGDGSIVRRGNGLAKLREAEVDLALEQDPSRGRVLATKPGVRFESACVLRTSRPKSSRRTPPAYDVPALAVREYADVVCRPKSVVEQRGLLLPDTYRHHLAKRLKHMSLRDVTDRFAVAPEAGEEEPLAGSYFHLDNEHRGFFGHALTEQVSRLWGWDLAREADPDVRVLVSLNRGREVADWELTLLEAAGVPRTKVVVTEGPVRVERLLSATPMFSMPKYVHPDITQTWDRIGGALRADAQARTYPARIFCSRRHEKRACLNRAEVERFFAEQGFEIVFPEEHPLPDQVEMFHQAEVVAGFAGSAMFTTMFSDRPKHVVLVSPDTYRPSNEYMIGSVRGHRLDIAVGTTPAELPPGTDEDRPLSWPFTVDLAVEGDWIRQALS